MKPAPFGYLAPSTPDEAIAALAEHRDDAKILAGGQSLLPLLKLRLARPRLLVDLRKLTGLSHIRQDDGALRLGAMTRQFHLEESPLIRERLPLLAEATSLIGHKAIRHQGTLGGSLAHADPAAELPVAILALEAELHATGSRGSRAIPADHFFASILTTALEPDELLAEIRLPLPPPGTGGAFVELARRTGDFAIVAVAALLTPGPGGTIGRARIALGGVGPVPTRARAVESALEGSPAGPDRFAAAAARAADGLDPLSDVHASADYRLTVLPVFVERALAAAWARADRRS